MLTIFKYPLGIQKEQTLELPLTAKVVAVGNQFEVLCLWALVDPTLPVSPYQIRVFATGGEISQVHGGLTFYGTVSTAQGNFIWHVFGTAPKVN